MAEGLGITVNMLCLRERESQKAITEKNITIFPGYGNARDEEAARLRKEVADLKETNEILKKLLSSSRKENPGSAVSVHEAVSRTVPGYEDGHKF